MLKMSCLKVNYCNLYLEDSALGKKKNLWCVWRPLLTFVMISTVRFVTLHNADFSIGPCECFLSSRMSTFACRETQLYFVCSKHCNKYSCSHISSSSELNSIKTSLCLIRITPKQCLTRHFGRWRCTSYRFSFISQEGDSFTIQIALSLMTPLLPYQSNMNPMQ